MSSIEFNSFGFPDLQPVFRRRAYQAFEETGATVIEPDVIFLIAAKYGTSLVAARAMAKVARMEVEKFWDEAEAEITQLIDGEDL